MMKKNKTLCRENIWLQQIDSCDVVEEQRCKLRKVRQELNSVLDNIDEFLAVLEKDHCDRDEHTYTAEN